MSVYTVVSLDAVQDFAQCFNLHVVALNPIKGGIENTNYFVTTSDGREFVLTLFEIIPFENANILAELMYRLSTHGLPVAVPLADYAGQRIHILAGKPAQLAPRLAGSSPHLPQQAIPTIPQVEAIGIALAQFHLALQEDPLQHNTTRQTTRGHVWWGRIKDELRVHMPLAHQQLVDEVFAKFDLIKRQHPDLPKGLIHADLFRDNTLYVGSQLSGLLDFSEVMVDDWLLDIAITLNDFCSTWDDVQNPVALNADKVGIFLAAYQHIRPMTDDELAALSIYLAIAACRFWFLRLDVASVNHAEGRVGEDVMEKDPEEMRRMVVDRLKSVCQ
ncbi:homoserine kinase [Aquirhabdus sp.]|uniref:homoserine kinase n=1 Tax=Aquirhabdus sp. TaxID=2824160 RepID=UPI00396C9B0B